MTFQKCSAITLTYTVRRIVIRHDPIVSQTSAEHDSIAYKSDTSDFIAKHLGRTSHSRTVSVNATIIDADKSTKQVPKLLVLNSVMDPRGVPFSNQLNEQIFGAMWILSEPSNFTRVVKTAKNIKTQRWEKILNVTNGPLIMFK